jgi:hypothetical protein
MALAAEHTKRIKLSTGVAIPSNRIEPVIAHSIATINLLAPGHTMLGIGSHFAGRNTMSLPPVPLELVRERPGPVTFPHFLNNINIREASRRAARVTILSHLLCRSLSDRSFAPDLRVTEPLVM